MADSRTKLHMVHEADQCQSRLHSSAALQSTPLTYQGILPNDPTFAQPRTHEIEKCLEVESTWPRKDEITPSTWDASKIEMKPPDTFFCRK